MPIISSMGAGNKLDGSLFQVADIYKTKVCPLAKVMRRELKKRGVKELKVVYSEEQPIVPHLDIEESRISVDGDASDIQQDARRRSVPGSVAFVPSVAGLLIAGEVVKRFMREVLQMKSRQIRNSLLLVLTAFIWGTAFVAQSKGGNAVGPFSFNCIRSLIGSIVLIPVIGILDKWNPSDKKTEKCSRQEAAYVWWNLLWCSTVFCKFGTTAWNIFGNIRRKGGFFNRMLYSSCSGVGTVFKEKNAAGIFGLEWELL